MSRSNKPVNPQAGNALDRMKYEIASELGIAERVRSQGWQTMTSADCGRVGGHMVRKMIEQYESGLSGTAMGTAGAAGTAMGGTAAAGSGGAMGGAAAGSAMGTGAAAPTASAAPAPAASPAPAAGANQTLTAQYDLSSQS